MAPENDKSVGVDLRKLHEEQCIAFGFHYETVAEVFPGPDSAATRFGLKQIGAAWRLIDFPTAREILWELLVADMAYGSPRLAPETAKAAAETFLGCFSPRARVYTNGSWDRGRTRSEDGKVSYGPEWTPATDATFDAGILVLDVGQTGVLWLEDED